MNSLTGLTVGRIVHYVRDDNMHCAAMVVGIHDSGNVDLIVFTADMATDVKRMTPFAVEPELRTWHWIAPAG